MTFPNRTRGRLLASAAFIGLIIASHPAVSSAATGPTPDTATGSEGADVQAVVVVAEASRAAELAPSKASVLETQPESIITHRYIEQATPETGDYTTAILIAPSVGGIAASGGGISETNKATMRGFADGYYNITFDGIAYGDTNDPTHHVASFFPASTIGTAVVDRGPGAAGDLGQANFGGAIHYFSQSLEDRASVSQKATFGSFNTQSYVTNFQSGPIKALLGTKMLLSLDERSSDTELSYSSGEAYNQTFKSLTPLGDKATLTLFISKNYTRFHAPDGALPPGETAAQIAAYGKNFSLTNDPNDEHYYNYNWEKKQTDFEYIDLKYNLDPSLTIEDQPYTFFYTNHTLAASNDNDLTAATLAAQGNTALINKSSLISAAGAAILGRPATDIQGYWKGNDYRVFGDILRVNKDFGFGTLRAGGLIETSWTHRWNLILDLSDNNLPDNKYKTPYVSNAKTLESSSWLQNQIFADFEWRPFENVTITPGIKQVDFTRKVDAVMENSLLDAARGPLNGQNTYKKTLYFLTANYRILPYWSVYAQTATGFLIPSLSYLYVGNLSLNHLKPQESTNYQTGTVYTHGPITVDADVYRIVLTDAEIAGPLACQCYVNGGTEHFGGIEGEFAYALPAGFNIFANGSTNSAKSLTTGAPPVVQVPKWTGAAGGLYQAGPWFATLTYKQVGAQYSASGTHLAPYSTIDATASYDFGHYKVKLGVFNLADRRSITQYNAPYYAFQVGRQVQLTLQAKF